MGAAKGNVEWYIKHMGKLSGGDIDRDWRASLPEAEEWASRKGLYSSKV